MGGNSAAAWAATRAFTVRLQPQLERSVREEMEGPALQLDEAIPWPGLEGNGLPVVRDEVVAATEADLDDLFEAARENGENGEGKSACGPTTFGHRRLGQFDTPGSDPGGPCSAHASDQAISTPSRPPRAERKIATSSASAPASSSTTIVSASK